MGSQPASSTSEQQREIEALLNGPAGAPPAGIQPKFDDPASLDTIIYITKTIALTLVTLAVFIRIYTRHVLLRSMGYDDCMFSYSCWFKLKYSNPLQDTCFIAWVDLPAVLDIQR